jgi:hypothetical protein
MLLQKSYIWACIAAVGMCATGYASVADLSKNGVALTVESQPDRVDVARDFEVTVTAISPAGVTVALPDLRDRFRGFSVAEDFAEEPVTAENGSVTQVSRWRLVPKPVEKVYKLAPFAVSCMKNGTDESFYTAPVYFEMPPARETVTGAVEVDPKKDMPPLSWRLVRDCAAVAALLAAVVWGVWWLMKRIVRKVREHAMSPIERAMLELGRLLEKGLPGRGRYKDFYVELTMVVRRYIQRKYGIRAPNMTTEEFLREAKPSDELRRFLESADMVKFAGVAATPEMADAATDSARRYLKFDSSDSPV